MNKNRRRLLDYLPPLVALAAATVAVVGNPKWDDRAEGLHRLTGLGWATLAVGILAFIATCMVTARNNRERTQERKTREDISSRGKARLLANLYHIIGPMMNENIWGREMSSPKSASDMLSQERHLKLGALNINSASPYAAGDFEEIRWYRIIEDAAREGSAEMITTLQIFVTYLPAGIIDTATKLLECEFLKIYLFHLHDLVDANTHIDKNRVVPMFMHISKEQSMDERGYREFWNLYMELENQCEVAVKQDDELHTPNLDEAFQKWAEFLNISVGVLSFTLGLACVATKTPSFNAMLCFIFAMLVYLTGQKVFPEEIRDLRRKSKKDKGAKRLLKLLMTKYLGTKALLLRFHVALFGLLFLIFIMFSHRLAIDVPGLAPLLQGYFGS